MHEPALNHVGLWVDDLAAAVAWLEGQGCASRRAASAKGPPATTSASSIPGKRRVPLGGEGVLIELVQAPPEVIEAHAAARA